MARKRPRGLQRGGYVYLTKEDMLVALSSITMNKRDLPPALQASIENLEDKLHRHLDLPVRKMKELTNGKIAFKKYRLYTELNLIVCPDGEEIEAPDMFTLLNDYHFDTEHLNRDVVVMTKKGNEDV